MKAKRIVMAIAVLVLVIAMACMLASCDPFGGGGGSVDKDTTYEVIIEYNSSAGSVSGGGKFKKGDTVTLTATANERFVFVGWQTSNSNEFVSTETEYTFIMGDENIKFYANFNDYKNVKLECDSDQGSVTGEDYYDVGSSVTIYSYS